MKLNFGFMKGMKSLFKDKNNNNRKKTRKLSKIIQDRIVGMYKGDESEVNHNVITPNTKPTQYQSVTKNKSLYKNKDIKYKNNKKKKRTKEKYRVQKLRESDDEDSSEEDDDDSVPGLQGRNQPDSDNEVDDRIDIEDNLDTERND